MPGLQPRNAFHSLGGAPTSPPGVVFPTGLIGDDLLQGGQSRAEATVSMETDRSGCANHRPPRTRNPQALSRDAGILGFRPMTGMTVLRSVRRQADNVLGKFASVSDVGASVVCAEEIRPDNLAPDVEGSSFFLPEPLRGPTRAVHASPDRDRLPAPPGPGPQPTMGWTLPRNGANMPPRSRS